MPNYRKIVQILPFYIEREYDDWYSKTWQIFAWAPRKKDFCNQIEEDRTRWQGRTSCKNKTPTERFKTRLKNNEKLSRVEEVPAPVILFIIYLYIYLLRVYLFIILLRVLVSSFFMPISIKYVFSKLIWYINALLFCHMLIVRFASFTKGVRKSCWSTLPIFTC